MGIHAPWINERDGITGKQTDQQAAGGAAVAITHDVSIFPGGGGVDAVTIKLTGIPCHDMNTISTDTGGIQAGDRVGDLLQVGNEIVNPIHASYPPSLYVGFTLSLPQ